MSNNIVYKYGGPNQESHFHTSIEEGRIARTNKKGLAVKNRKPGDHVTVIAEKFNGDFKIAVGLYIGLDPLNKDVWQDPDANYDRENIELWKHLTTITVSREDMFDFVGQGTYNDNGRHAGKWLDMALQKQSA